MDFTAISKWLEDNYILVFIVVPGIVAHILPHVPPEWQQRLGVVGKCLNVMSGNYRHAANTPKAKQAEAVVSALAPEKK